MIWIFERGPELARIETRFDNASRTYVLRIEWGDGREEIERYQDVVAFDARIRELEAQLKKDDWRQLGPPGILSEGWRGP